MDNSGYVTLTRQSGLLAELQSVAHNIANAATTGFRAEGVVFAEYVKAVDGPGGSLSMARADVRRIDLSQGTLTQTGGSFDLAIEGEGFFQLETPQGLALTRAGSFGPNEAGDLVNPQGHRLLDLGGAPVFVPPDARSIAIAADGTLSADGRALAQIGLVRPTDPTDLPRGAGTLFTPQGAVEPVEDATILQGFLEGSNVDPVSEIARMIEVQHAYELGQSFLEREDERARAVIRTLGS